MLHVERVRKKKKKKMHSSTRYVIKETEGVNKNHSEV
jgi:hypothetical protein